MIIALAGRRIDEPNTPTPLFPLDRVPAVHSDLRKLFTARGATALVCGAACGADLIALDVAGELQMRRRVVLSHARDAYRRISVIDRPGDWGWLFDRICQDVEATGDLIVLPGGAGDEGSFLAGNQAILDQALVLAPTRGSAGVLAVAVWEGAPRGPGDITGAFVEEAHARGLQVLSLPT